jgi:peptide subunit release factor 1 (eRF1)
MDAVDLRNRVTELARIENTSPPVLSVYLSTRWADEHERERARIFLKNELRRARRSEGLRAHAADLDWLETEGATLIGQGRFADAHGVALFACQGLALREVLAVQVPVEDRMIVATRPFVLPLAAALESVPAAVVVFVDTEHARLIPLDATGPGTEVALEAEVPGRHSRGGWAQMAQTRYQRHILDHRDRHFQAVAESLGELVDRQGVERIVLAGDPRNVAAFRAVLPGRIAGKIAGAVEGGRSEPAAALVARATKLLNHGGQQRQTESVDAVLTEAAKSRQAVAGVEETLDAINRGAVHRLYLAKGFTGTGHACEECGALARGDGAKCRLCGGQTTRVELEHAMPERVLAAGGRVEIIDLHAALTRVGGVAALLRYSL